MGIILLMISVILFTHSGALIERSKNADLTKINLFVVSGIEFIAAIYFLIAAIGRLDA